MTSRLVKLRLKPNLPPDLQSEAERYRTWLINAPWAHPWWQDYLLSLYPINHPDCVHFKAGVTHEFMLYALEDGKLPEIDADGVPLGPFVKLTPANMSYQFRAENDEAAIKRMQEIVDAIDRMQVSPDTDYRSQWDQAFSDGVSLLKSTFFGGDTGLKPIDRSKE